MAGFDIVFCSVNPREIEEGIYKVTYGNNVNAVLYCWQVVYDCKYIVYRGLIVKEDDVEYNQDAKEKFDKRKATL